MELTLEEAVAEWCSLSAQCIARVHHHLAFSALRRGSAREAFAQWQQACHQGDPRAHFNLALCYELGKGTAKDLRKVSWCRPALWGWVWSLEVPFRIFSELFPYAVDRIGRVHPILSELVGWLLEVLRPGNA